ncbi:MAG: hypothetical protein IPJ16_02010, partial [Bacteroidales bacterium]|nr:hypothetical protein [Bacteroidales bacterium]
MEIIEDRHNKASLVITSRPGNTGMRSLEEKLLLMQSPKDGIVHNDLDRTKGGISEKRQEN